MTPQSAFASALSLLQQMIAIPSVSRDEQAVADMLQAQMARLSGLEVHRHHNNLWLVAPGFDATRPTLLLNAHLDTVRPAASWQRDPFTPTIEEITLPDGTTQQRLYGLGANDDGASLVSLLHVFVMLCEAGPLNSNLIFLASAEEEVSGKNGIDSVLNNDGPLAWLTRSDAPVVAVVGEPTGMQPAIAEKGLVVLDGVAYGKSGHAARNEGINALYRAVDAITVLRNYAFTQVSETLGPVKVTVTGIQCGTTHNVIPDHCTFMVDCRTTDAYTNEEVVAQLQNAIGAVTTADEAALPSVTLSPRSTRLQASGISTDHPIVSQLIALGRQPFGSPTLSDQALMRFPSLKVGPGQSSRSHTADEYICPNEIREAISLYYTWLSTYLQPREFSQ